MKNAIPISKPEDIRLEDLPFRYPMKTACTIEAEILQTNFCVAQGYERLKLLPLREDCLDVVGYGPSLIELWPRITHPCMTVSGAHDFLIRRGLSPEYHVECDGRDHKTKHLEKPCKDTLYLMAAICHPLMWVQLKGYKIQYWHNANGKHIVDWIGANDAGAILVAGGSNVGLSAIHVAGILGFRRFRLFGFDGNFRDGVRHAGPHYGPPQKIIERKAGGRIWQTTPQMSNACDEFMWLARNPEVTFDVMGDSLLRAIVDGTKNESPDSFTV